MLVNNIRPDDHIYPSATKSCAILGRSDIGQSIHCLVLKTGYDRDVVVASSLNLGMWNAMLIAFAQHSQTEKVFDLFKQMEGLGIKPNFITFLCVLYACSHTGLVEKGQHYFELMKEYGIEPGDQHYASLVDLFGRAVKLQEALSIIREMPIRPTESVWKAFLTGCRLHGNTELADYAADRIFELGPELRYEDAAKARKMLRDRGIKKETGLSWVEEGNKVHTFAAGDRSHAKAKEIYRKLEELGDKMERAGYIADTSFVLREVNGEEKNQTIRYHNRAIRVMKNLRICGDCHTAIKFMSKCTGRVISVRDSNGFHHFEDGKCSCGDYW
ncbi:hypothetical protein ES332_A01G233000v1 [Gossypium tomentosum]|uniref:DYW domain-containing protein n=1 Tax=Gossypium tomentosum TaxID=34277 RepID=A0A5D2RX72_GOSTO|nr:hypothetical protein ES332_A01G233000v1 [Gossypium tomentosum]